MTAVGDARKRLSNSEHGTGATNTPNAAPSATDALAGSQGVEAIRAKCESWERIAAVDAGLRNGGIHRDHAAVLRDALAALDESRSQSDSFAEQLLAERHDHKHTKAELTRISAINEENWAKLGGYVEAWGPLLAEKLRLQTEVDESRAEVALVRRGARTLGHIVETQGRDALDASGMHHVIGEDGDGDWAVVWEVLAELRPRVERAEARATAAEAVVASVRELAATWAASGSCGDGCRAAEIAAAMTNALLTPTTTDETEESR